MVCHCERKSGPAHSIQRNDILNQHCDIAVGGRCDLQSGAGENEKSMCRGRVSTAANQDSGNQEDDVAKAAADRSVDDQRQDAAAERNVDDQEQDDGPGTMPAESDTPRLGPAAMKLQGHDCSSGRIT